MITFRGFEKSPPGGGNGRPEWGLVLAVDGPPGAGRWKHVAEVFRRYGKNNRKINR